jgi:hypothetical protein
MRGTWKFIGIINESECMIPDKVNVLSTCVSVRLFDRCGVVAETIPLHAPPYPTIPL